MADMVGNLGGLLALLGLAVLEVVGQGRQLTVYPALLEPH